MRMRTKDLVLLALFMGIGAVLHIISPPILFGMKPDIMLPMMFLGIMMFPKVSYVVVVSLATGVISALTTDRKSTRLNSSHVAISYAVFCLKKKNNFTIQQQTDGT